jgi:hypothetical protein
MAKSIWSANASSIRDVEGDLANGLLIEVLKPYSTGATGLLIDRLAVRLTGSHDF